MERNLVVQRPTSRGSADSPGYVAEFSGGVPKIRMASRVLLTARRAQQQCRSALRADSERYTEFVKAEFIGSRSRQTSDILSKFSTH